METEVREVFHKGSQSVVEWRDENGNVHRSIFPEIALIHRNGSIFVDAVEEGHPYGVDWVDYAQPKMGPEEIAQQLRNRGIWTLDDLVKKTSAVTSVFNEASSINLQSFRESVLRQGKDE